MDEFRTVIDGVPMIDVMLSEQYERDRGLPMESRENTEEVVAELEDRAHQVQVALNLCEGEQFYYVQDLLSHGLEKYLIPALESAREKLSKFSF